MPQDRSESQLSTTESTSTAPAEPWGDSDEILRLFLYSALTDISGHGEIDVDTLKVFRTALSNTNVFSNAFAHGPSSSSSMELLASWIGGIAESQHVNITEVLDALRPTVVATIHSRQRAVDSIDNFVKTLTPSMIEFDPVPKGALEQARRQAALRSSLLAKGAYTIRALAEGRRASVPATRQFVHRAKSWHELFTVPHDGEALIPSFLFDEGLQLKVAFASAIDWLTSVGEDGWALWTWFSTPSEWLGGSVPAEVVESDPDRVTLAARRRASNAA